MPKEFINNRYYGQSVLDHNKCPDRDTADGCPGGPQCRAERVALDDSAVKVGWTKDRAHVEIAIVRGAGELDEHCWHSQLDRDGLNRLIRSLRKARDQAYGADA